MIKKYEKHKKTGVEWIGNLPINWKAIKFKHITTLMTCGHAATPKYVDEEAGGVPFLSAQNIKKEKIVFSPLKFVDEELHEKLTKNHKLEKGDLLQARVGGVSNIGQTAIYEDDREMSIYVSLSHIKLKSIAHNNYVRFLCNSSAYQEHAWTLMKKGGGVANFNVSDQEKIRIPLPSFEEQTKIAEYLDHQTGLIDEIIEKKKILIQKLKEQRQAIINEAVTKGLNPNTPMKESGLEWLGEIPEHWQVVKFRYKFNTTKGLTITKSDLLDNGIPCVNYGEIHSKYGFEVNPEIHNLKYVSADYIEKNKNSLLSKGDFVFADTSEDIEGSGNFTHLNSDIPIFAGYHTIIARLNDTSDYRYFAYYFDSSTYRTQIQNLVKGVKVYSITNKILKDTFLLCPPEDEQMVIAQKLDKIVNKIFAATMKLEKSIKKLKLFRQSIISEAVTGKIDVREWEPKVKEIA